MKNLQVDLPLSGADAILQSFMFKFVFSILILTPHVFANPLGRLFRGTHGGAFELEGQFGIEETSEYKTTFITPFLESERDH